MKEIAVSVICITYNQAEYIRDALEGFLMQRTSFAYEILIHDDASTDGTDRILMEYQEKYPEKIRLFLEEENQYSKGKDIIKDILRPHIRGKYMACCEGDDYWIYYGKLQAQYDLMEVHPEVSLCYHNAVVYDEGKDELTLNVMDHRSGYVEEQDVVYPSKGWYPTASAFSRTEYALNYQGLHAPTGDEGRRCYMACCGRLYYINKAWCVYRNRSRGSWNGKFDNDEKVALKYICDSVTFLEEFDAYSNGKYKKYFYERLKSCVMWYVYAHCSQWFTVEQFRSYIEKLKSATEHKADKLLNRIYAVEAIHCIDYYPTIIKKELAGGVRNLYLYDQDAEVITAIVELIMNRIDISGIIMTKKDKNTRIFDYPIYGIDEIKVSDDVTIWPVCFWKREQLISSLQDRGFKNIII